MRLDAVESYVRGLLATSAEQRHRFFTQAARLDEHYSQPCFQLGKIYWERKDYKIAAGWFQRVARSRSALSRSAVFPRPVAAITTAISPAPRQAFQLVAAADAAQRGVTTISAPRRTAATIPRRAIASFQKALEGDSADPDYHFNLGYAQWRSGQYAAAVESFRAAVARNPNDTEATALLGRALKEEAPRPGDPKIDGRERVKTNYDEAAYRQLQAELAK